MTKQEIILDYKFLIELVKQAGVSILEIYNSDDFGVEIKEDNSPLTKADQKSHEIITKALKKYNIPILSEEGKEISYEERSHWDLFWLIDPIDGTKEFIKKNGEFTVNIALIENQKPVFGIVGLPVFDTVFIGGEQIDAFSIQKDITSKLVPKLENTCSNIVVASKSFMNEETEKFIASLNNTTTIQVGSSLKFMMLVQNKASLYPRFGPTMEWDTAASHAILHSLGYSIKTIEGVELIYNKKHLLNPYFIAD